MMNVLVSNTSGIKLLDEETSEKYILISEVVKG